MRAPFIVLLCGLSACSLIAKTDRDRLASFDDAAASDASLDAFNRSDGGNVDVIDGAIDGTTDDARMDARIDGTITTMDATLDATTLDATPDAPRDGALADRAPDLSSCVQHCEGSTLVGCATPPVACALGCNSTAARCNVLEPSHLSAEDITAGEGEIVVDFNATFSTDTCAPGPGLPFASGIARVDTLDDATSVCILQLAHFEIEAERTLTVTGARPLVVLASDDILIDGRLQASAVHETPGPGGSRGGNVSDPSSAIAGSGAGTAGGAWGVNDMRYDSGGGGGGLCGSGGNGGSVLDGSTVLLAGGTGGPAVSTWTTGLLGGSGGGRGRGATAGGFTSAGIGGAGGGAVQLSAANQIVVGPDGIIAVAGGGARGGTTTVIGNAGSGGGGGSGGTIWIEAPSITLDRDARFYARGGGGGGAPEGTHFNGGDGRDGAAGSDPARGGSESGTRGGGGARATSVNGDDGDDYTGTGVLDVDRNAGGGGGGAGCFVIRGASDGVMRGPNNFVPNNSANVDVSAIEVR